MKLRNRIFACTLACLTAFAGFVLPLAGAQTGRTPAAVEEAETRVTFIIYRGADGEIACREATTDEYRRIAQPPGDDLHLIYRGAPLTRTDEGIVESYSAMSPGVTDSEMLQTLLPSAGLHIFLHGTTQLEAHPEAKNAFVVAANRWEAVVSTRINVVLDVDYGETFFDPKQPYGEGVVGQTISVSDRYPRSFSDVRQHLIDKFPTAAELSLYNALPATALPVEGRPSSDTPGVSMTRANARALGFVDDIPVPDSVALLSGDARIGFNSAFNFDFNPDDGISSNMADFDAVVTHEIGHALGFTSNNGGDDTSFVKLWDVFRFRPGAASLATLATAPRVMAAGGTQVFFNAQEHTVEGVSTQELELSTGGLFGDAPGGDRQQSGHWKDDQLTGRHVGIMDPTIKDGVRRVITANDANTLDTLGYSISGTVAPANDYFSAAQTISGMSGSVNGITGMSGSVNGINVSATKELGEPNHANNPGGASVWYQWQAPVTGNVTFTTAGSSYDTLLAAYTGVSVGALTRLASNNDVGNGNDRSSSITFPVTAGRFYRIAVDGWNRNAGSVKLNWSLVQPCTYSFLAAVQNFDSPGGTGSVEVKAAAGCGWTVANNSSFVTIISGASGSGDGTVTYSVAANANASPRAGTLTIPGATYIVNQLVGISSVRIATTALSVNESARKVEITVQRLGSTATAATVQYATVDGTASRLKDYTQTLGTLFFAPTDSEETVTIFITDDVFDEPAETFTFTLLSASGATFLSSSVSAVVTINSEDDRNGSNPVGDAAFNADFFVRQHYVDFLNRAPDDAGFAFWTGEITQCGANISCRDVKRVNVSAAFFLSIEFQRSSYLVYKTYKAAFGNLPGKPVPVRHDNFMPDARAISDDIVVSSTDPTWESRLNANIDAYLQAFVQRNDFRAANSSATAAPFVDGLFTHAGVTPTSGERSAAITAFGTGNTAGRAAALRSVVESQTLHSAEFNKAFVLSQYFGYLRRDPDSAPDADFAGYNHWLGKLNEFNGNYIQAEMVKAFINSTEYRQRFGP